MTSSPAVHRHPANGQFLFSITRYRRPTLASKVPITMAIDLKTKVLGPLFWQPSTSRNQMGYVPWDLNMERHLTQAALWGGAGYFPSGASHHVPTTAAHDLPVETGTHCKDQRQPDPKCNPSLSALLSEPYPSVVLALPGPPKCPKQWSLYRLASLFGLLVPYVAHLCRCRYPHL